jgi:hypothetical protein
MIGVRETSPPLTWVKLALRKEKNKKKNPSELTKKAVINLTSMLSLFKYE